jgi:hypothetical protein
MKKKKSTDGKEAHKQKVAEGKRRSKQTDQQQTNR